MSMGSGGVTASILPINRTVASVRFIVQITAVLDENKNGLPLLSFYQSKGISKKQLRIGW